MLKEVLLLFFVVFQICFSIQASFITSFQTNIDGSPSATDDVWLEFSNPVPESKEFTICHWIKIKYYNNDFAACLWSYCGIERADEEMKCLQLCLTGDLSTANQNLLIQGWIHVQKGYQLYTFAKLKSYHHRKWSHFCWSLSVTNKRSWFYHNGVLLGTELIEVEKSDMALMGSEVMHETSFIFGQEPDALGGYFDKSQAFIGELSEFNIWNHTLKESNISAMASCEALLKGNVLAWEKSNLIIEKVQVQDLPDNTMLCADEYRYAIFPTRVKFPEAKETCEAHGGSVALPKSDKDSTMFLRIVSKHKKECIEKGNQPVANAIWIGARKLDGVWWDDSTANRKAIRLNYSNEFQAGSSYDSSCTYMRDDGTWKEGSHNLCYIYLSLCTLCQITNQPLLTLKGACERSGMDWNYYPQIDDSNLIKKYEGYKKMNILFHESTGMWTFTPKSQYVPNFVASLSTIGLTKKHLAGLTHWSIDDPTCHVKNAHYPLTISVCKFPFEFTCGSGLCIEISKRCNEKKDCLDGSDEDLCSLIQFPDSYDKANAPGPEGNDNILNIEIKSRLVKINSINTINMMNVFTLELDLKWHDNRLKFSNPTKNTENMVTAEEAQKIWTPLQDIIHENAIVGNIEYDKATVIKLIPIQAEQGNPAHSRENVLFNGTYNPLKLRQRMKVKYDCVFDVRKFPFDRKNCLAIIKINRPKVTALSFVGDTFVRYEGPSFVHQFSIGRIKSNINNTDESTKFIITVPMMRIVTNQLLNKFIPTFLLWLFGYATIFIDLDNFSDRFMGSATALLVMATLLNSINADLPKTSYMKLIDLWFLWHVVSLFAILIYHIVIDRVCNHLEAKTTKSEVVSFSSLVEEKYITFRRLNILVISSFPILNFIFYIIYFYQSII